MLGLTKQEQGIALFLILGLVVGGVFELYQRYAGEAEQPVVDPSMVAAFQQRARELNIPDPAAKPASMTDFSEVAAALQSESQVQPTDAVAVQQDERAEGIGTIGNKFLININTASQKELQRIPRVGPATAQKIINHRLANGRFKTIDDLVEVKGIGKSTLERIRPYVTLN